MLQKTKLYPEEIDDEDDPFEGEDELPSLQQLVHEIDSTCDALTFISSEDQIDVCQGYIDDSNANWREEVRNDLFDDEDDEIAAIPEISENIKKTITDFFVLEIHIVTLKAFPTREFRSKYTAPPLKYTTDILWSFFS